MNEPESLYAQGARVGSKIGGLVGALDRVVGNVRDYLQGITDAARVCASASDETEE